MEFVTVFSAFWQEHWVLAILIMSGVSLLAGMVDSIAGGGGLFTLPAWLWLGVPAPVAIAQSKFISTLGTLMATFNFLKHRQMLWKVILVGVPFSLLGAIIGARVLLWIDPKVVLFMVLCLTPVAMILVLWPKNKEVKEVAGLSSFQLWVLVPICCLLVGFYDGIFGPATGSILILAMHYGLHLDLLKASANAKVFNLASNIGALVLFMWAGKIFYLLCFFPMLMNVLGNYIGSHLAMRKGAQVVKKALLLSMAVLFITVLIRFLVSA